MVAGVSARVDSVVSLFCVEAMVVAGASGDEVTSVVSVVSIFCDSTVEAVCVSLGELHAVVAASITLTKKILDILFALSMSLPARG